MPGPPPVQTKSLSFGRAFQAVAGNQAGKQTGVVVVFGVAHLALCLGNLLCVARGLGRQQHRIRSIRHL